MKYLLDTHVVFEINRSVLGNHYRFFCTCLILSASHLCAAEREIDLSRTPSGDVRFEIQGLVVPTDTARSILDGPRRQYDLKTRAPTSDLDLLKAAPQAVVFAPTSITLAPNAVGGVPLAPVGKKGTRPTMRIDFVHRHECVALTVTQTAPKILARPVFMTTDSFNVTYHSNKVFTGPLKNQPELTLYLEVRAIPGNPSLSFRLPRLEFDRHSIWESMAEIRAQSSKLNPSAKALNFVVDTWNIREDTKSEITLFSIDIPIGEAIEHVANLASYRLEHNKHTVVVKGLSYLSAELLTHEVKLSKEHALEIAAQTPANWLTQLGIYTDELPSKYQPHLDQESETLTLSLSESKHTRLSLFLRLLGDTSQPDSLPKPWRKAMSINLPHVRLRTESLEQALEDLSLHLKGKDAPPIVIDPSTSDSDRQAPFIDLDLRQIPLADVLRYLALQSRTFLIEKDDSLAFVSYLYWQR